MKKKIVLILGITSMAMGLPLYNPMDPMLLKEGWICPCAPSDCTPVCRMDDSKCLWDTFMSGCYEGFSFWDFVAFKASFCFDYVYDRKMEIGGGQFLQNHTAQLRHVQISSLSGRFDVIIGQTFAMFGSLGSLALTQREGRVFPVGIIENDFQFKGISEDDHTETDFMWSLGFLKSFYYCDCLGLGVSLEYKQGRPDMNRASAFLFDPNIYSEAYIASEFNTNPKVRYREMQAGGGISTWIHLTADGHSGLSPYMGVKFSYAELNYLKSTVYKPYLKSNSTGIIGFSHGITLIVEDMISITVEGRWLDEKGVYTNAQIRF